MEPTADSRRGAPHHARGLELALVTAVISGIAVYVNGQAVRRFESPTVYTTGKNLVAGALLILVAGASGQLSAWRRSRTADSRRRSLSGVQMLELFGVAVVGGGVAFVLFFEGLARATSTDAAFIHKTMVIWAAVLAVVILREQVGALQVVAVALLIAGHVVIVGGIGSLRFGAGELMILAATLMWSAEVVVVKKLLVELPPAMVGAVRVAGGATLLVVWLAITGRLDNLASMSGSQVGWLVLTGTLLTGFVVCWYSALECAAVVDVTAVLVLGAVVTGALDVVVGHAPVGVRFPGWALITAGVAIVAARRLSTTADGRWAPRTTG